MSGFTKDVSEHRIFSGEKCAGSAGGMCAKLLLSDLMYYFLRDNNKLHAVVGMIIISIHIFRYACLHVYIYI